MGNYVEPESNPASPYSHHCLKCTHTVPPSLAIFEPAELPPFRYSASLSRSWTPYFRHTRSRLPPPSLSLL